MRSLYVWLTVLFFGFTVQAQDLVWHTDVQKAMEISNKSKKPMLLFFTGSDWCGWCIRLQKEVLQTPDFAKWAKENVVLVELDFPKRTAQSNELKMQNAQLQQFLQVRGYPTVWIVNMKKGKEGNIEIEQLGRTGYVAGGPSKWLEGANQILATKK